MSPCASHWAKYWVRWKAKTVSLSLKLSQFRNPRKQSLRWKSASMLLESERQGSGSEGERVSQVGKEQDETQGVYYRLTAAAWYEAPIIAVSWHRPQRCHLSYWISGQFSKERGNREGVLFHFLFPFTKLCPEELTCLRDRVLVGAGSQISQCTVVWWPSESGRGGWTLVGGVHTESTADAE